MAQKAAAKKTIYESQQSLYEKAVLKMNADQVIVQHAYKIDNYNIAAAMFDEVGDYLDAPALAAKCRELAAETAQDEKRAKYAKALNNMDQIKDPDVCRKIIQELESLGSYEDAPKLLQKCRDTMKKQERSSKAKMITAAGVIFLIIAGTVIGNSTGFFRYLLGIGYLKMNKTEKAEAIFSSMPGFLDSDRYLEEMGVDPSEELQVESTIEFGDFRWKVLDMDDQTLTVMAVGVTKKHLFGRVPFHEEQTQITWKDSSLREWLNTTVYEECFSDAEREAILLWENGPSVNAVYGTSYEDTTQDYLSVLSVEEAQPYMEILKTMGRDFWFRTPGAKPDTACFMSAGGHLPREYGYPVTEEEVAVRPVLRLDRSKM